MTKNKDPMLQELGMLLNPCPICLQAKPCPCEAPTMQRPDVIPSLKHMLKRQYEDGYDSACDTLEETIVELERLRKTNEGLRYENIKARIMFEHAVRKMVAISGFAHPDGFVINGKGYSFHPPENLVREAWEALSKAIREIDTTKLGDPAVEPTFPPAYKYPETFCSQCGGEFGPGNQGFSHCENHKHLPRL